MTVFYICEKDYARVDSNGNIVEPLLITGHEYAEAERGNSYLNSNDFEFYGEFLTFEDCLHHYINEVGESLFCKAFDL